MDVTKLTGAIVKQAELSGKWLWWGFPSGLNEEEGEFIGGRPSAPSSTGCVQEIDDEECKSRECLLTRSQSELRAFNRGRRPSMHAQANKLVSWSLVP